MINLHRYEALYYVGTYQGIGPAARNIPWTAGKSAVSKQIAAFEREVGTKLFVRDPFAWLPAGQRLFEDIKPLYERLAAHARETCGLTGALLRIGASEFILREYIVPLLDLLRRRHPGLRLEFHAGHRRDIDGWLRSHLIDVAIFAADEPPEAFGWQPLLTLPLVLLTPAHDPRQHADEFWARAPVTHRLVTPPESEGATRRFGAGLRERNISWPVAVQASSTALVPWLVAAGQGVGLCVGAAGLLRHDGVRALPLPGFGQVTVGAVWLTETPELRTMLELVGQLAQKLNAVHTAALNVPTQTATSNRDAPSRPGLRATTRAGR